MAIAEQELEALDGLEQGGNLTLEEFEQLSTMFASQKTCEERDRNFTETLNRLSNAVDKLAEATVGLHDVDLEHEARIKAIEDCGKRQRRSVDVKISIAVLMVAVISQLDWIIGLFKAG